MFVCAGFYLACAAGGPARTAPEGRVPLDSLSPLRRGWVRRLAFPRAAWPCQTGGRAKGRLR
ncbi:hypothetical protein D7X33_04960 [Butyricicoccus sp. 1XD8-22]|nr:hypothetical protein D7X33_04960 [Butyricicoccus sp. 1XD8-22]